ncbi:hypothetical protein TKK_0012470 [Trichogramma kaykai]
MPKEPAQDDEVEGVSDEEDLLKHVILVPEENNETIEKPREYQTAPKSAPAGENNPEILEIAGMCQENRHYDKFSLGGQEYMAFLDPGANITGIHAHVAERFPDHLESKEGWIGGATWRATRTTGVLLLTITVDDTTNIR